MGGERGARVYKVKKEKGGKENREKREEGGPFSNFISSYLSRCLIR